MHPPIHVRMRACMRMRMGMHVHDMHVRRSWRRMFACSHHTWTPTLHTGMLGMLGMLGLSCGKWPRVSAVRAHLGLAPFCAAHADHVACRPGSLLCLEPWTLEGL